MRKGFATKLAVVGIAACAAIYGLAHLDETTNGNAFLDNTMDNDEHDFMKFITKYRKTYGTKEEYNYRLNVFKNNLAKIRDA